MVAGEVPIWEKPFLTISEAALFYNVGEKTLRLLTKSPNDFTVVIGSKVLIKKYRFERWLENQYLI